MSDPLVIQISDSATPSLQAMRVTLDRPRALMAAVGKRGQVELRAHFRRRQAEGNKKGWREQYFWRGSRGNSVSEKTALTSVTDTVATITIADPRFAFKVTGGTIRPQAPRKFLAIPLREEAYGRRPSERDDADSLFAIRARGKLYLVKHEGIGSALRIQYLLVRQVTQAADPRALPPAGAMEAAFEDETTKFFARETLRSAKKLVRRVTP